MGVVFVGLRNGVVAARRHVSASRRAWSYGRWRSTRARSKDQEEKMGRKLGTQGGTGVAGNCGDGQLENGVGETTG